MKKMELPIRPEKDPRAPQAAPSAFAWTAGRAESGPRVEERERVCRDEHPPEHLTATYWG